MQPGKFRFIPFFALTVAVLSGCNGMYITGPAHPFEWATANTIVPASDVPGIGEKALADCRGMSRQSNTEMYLPEVLCIDTLRLSKLEYDYYHAAPSADDHERQNYRDEWVQTLMRDIDVLWWGFKNGFLSATDAAKVTSDTLVTGLAAASAGITAQTAKTIAAVAAAVLNGWSGSFNQNVLQNQIAPALFASVEADRANIDTQIVKGLAKSTKDYSLAMASRDVMRYANAGSISNAISDLAGQAGKAASEANATRNLAADTPHAASNPKATRNNVRKN